MKGWRASTGRREEILLFCFAASAPLRVGENGHNGSNDPQRDQSDDSETDLRNPTPHPETLAASLAFVVGRT